MEENNEILNRNEYNQRCKRGGNRRPSPRKVGKQTFCPGGPAFGDVETEPVLQDISGEQLSRWSYKAQDARFDIHVLGFWERHRSAFFDVRVFHPNAESYKDHNRSIQYPWEREKASVLKESSWHWAWNIYTFGLHHNWRNGKEVLNLSYSRLAQLIQERGAVCQNYLMDQNPNRSFALLRSGLVCRRGSRASRVPWDIKNADMLKEPFNRTIDVFPHFLIFFFIVFFYS